MSLIFGLVQLPIARSSCVNKVVKRLMASFDAVVDMFSARITAKGETPSTSIFLPNNAPIESNY